MKIGVVCAGSVGLVAGTCFAVSGNAGTCLDIDADRIARRMKAKVVFDGRNLHAHAEMRARGFACQSIGKVPVGRD
jgi:UDP-glucose 6-dehydrogenase